jgi:hypothetical protein
VCYETVVFIVKRDFGIDTEDGDNLIFFANSLIISFDRLSQELISGRTLCLIRLLRSQIHIQSEVRFFCCTFTETMTSIKINLAN